MLMNIKGRLTVYTETIHTNLHKYSVGDLVKYQGKWAVVKALTYDTILIQVPRHHKIADLTVGLDDLTPFTHKDADAMVRKVINYLSLYGDTPEFLNYKVNKHQHLTYQLKD